MTEQSLGQIPASVPHHRTTGNHRWAREGSTVTPDQGASVGLYPQTVPLTGYVSRGLRHLRHLLILFFFQVDFMAYFHDLSTDKNIEVRTHQGAYPRHTNPSSIVPGGVLKENS